MWKPFSVITVFFMIFLPYKIVYSQTDVLALALKEAIANNLSFWIGFDFLLSMFAASMICALWWRFFG